MEVQEKKADDRETSLLDLFIVMAKRKKLLLTVTLAVTLLMAVLTFYMDSVYQGTARILIPQNNTSASAMIGQALGISGGIISGLTGGSNPTSMYASLIKSRKLADGLLDQFHLYDLYKKDRIFPIRYFPFPREEAVKRVQSDIVLEPDTDSGVIDIHFNSKDQDRVADMTNFIVDGIMNLNQGLLVTDASHRRSFYEGELRKTQDSLGKAENDLRSFQEASGAIQIDDQAKAILEGIATLEAQIAAQEVQIRVMKTYATPQNPDLKRAIQQLDGLREQQRKLESRSENMASSIIPTSQIPSLGTDYLRKVREFKYQETLYLMLLKMLESARMDEAMESGAIQIVDRAVRPDARNKPKPIVMIIAGIFVGFILAVFAAFFAEYLERKSVELDSRDKWKKFRYYLRRF